MFDGNGNWTSEFSAQVDRDNGIKILASRFDNIFIADIKESFENCITKDGQIGFIGNLNVSGNKIINVRDGTNTTDAVNKGQIDDLLQSLYPIGSIYIGTQATCPLTTLIAGSQWQLVAQNRALWGGNGSNANTTIEAGLPNITGTTHAQDGYLRTPTNSGAFKNWVSVSGSSRTGDGGKTASYGEFDASASNPIYGNSTTVQPPAYRVNVWRRTA